MPLYRFPTAIGDCCLAHDHTTLTAFRLPPGGPAAPEPDGSPAPAWVRALAERVVAHLAGAPQDFGDAPFAWQTVSAFQQAVYRAALAVKPGHTATYGALAAALGQPPGASRAIGTALGQNPWPLLVPCHRFLGADGRMTGFSGPGGIATKVRLLALERAELFGEA